MLARLYVLDLGLFHIHDKRTIGIPGYVLRTTDDRWLLIDTGFRAEYASNAALASQADGLAAFGELLGYGPHHSLPVQLSAIGLTIDDISTLFLSHTHIDHVGWLPQFAGKHIVMHASERALAAPLYFASRSPFGFPEANYTLVTGDTEWMRGLRILHTPGHTPGHLSFELDLPKTGGVVLACDAINRASEFAEGFENAQTRMQAERVRDRAHAGRSWLVYGHDPAQWSQLHKAPGYYD